MHFIACVHMLAGAAEFMLPVTDVMCGVTRRAGTASHLLYDVSLGRTTISRFCVARVTLKRRLESSVPRLPKRVAFQSGCAGWSMRTESVVADIRAGYYVFPLNQCLQSSTSSTQVRATVGY